MTGGLRGNELLYFSKGDGSGYPLSRKWQWITAAVWIGGLSLGAALGGWILWAVSR